MLSNLLCNVSLHEGIMVGEKALLHCLILATAVSLAGCATTAPKLAGTAGWNDGVVNSRASAFVDETTLTSDEALPLARKQVVTVGNERGGYVVDYAIRMMKLQQNNTPVRFTGRCDSACTLYLALPPDQTCIARGASFRFHAPRASRQRASRAARAYMLNTYPEWVTTWIDAKGGLSGRLMTMDYSYASQHLRRCEELAGSGDNAQTMLPTENRLNSPTLQLIVLNSAA
jgi:hypothetical protein